MSSKAIIGFIAIICTALADDPLAFTSMPLPQGYTFDHGLGTDSYIGRIHKEGGLTINTDTGMGRYVIPENQSSYEWFREIEIGEEVAYLAMVSDSNKRLLTLTFKRIPVNFRAEIHSEAEIAEFIAILSAYKLPKK